MSTFNGLVDEFPNIRVDFFRTHPDRAPPAACFLSHVHSDHLQGLESLRMPFVYCSATTRRMLLEMEKYRCRINFAKGILEKRVQTYKHLRTILRPLPYNTRTELELGPKSKIYVTLLDANHCPGAAMFLIEGDGKAVLYTGDVRAEPWWVNSIIRNPVLIPYACGLRRLDCIYLDTTFATHDDIYREFPTKADGLRELLLAVDQCPEDSIYYFRAWTVGYEDVWVALSQFLGSRVHVDPYQVRLYGSLSSGDTNLDTSLSGHQVGGHFHPGCLTSGPQTSIHSCEPGMSCHARLVKQKSIIWLIPIISRLENGIEVREVGAGGGGGDLYQAGELDLSEASTVEELLSACARLIKNEEMLGRIRERIQSSRVSRALSLSLYGITSDQEHDVVLEDLIDFISNDTDWPTLSATLPTSKITHAKRQQKEIHFPYSRHSSFSELRNLVSVFRPKDIWPCTVDEKSWTDNVSIQSLFGDLCSENTFRHDNHMRTLHKDAGEVSNLLDRRKRKRSQNSSQDANSGSNLMNSMALRNHRTQSDAENAVGDPVNITDEALPENSLTVDEEATRPGGLSGEDCDSGSEVSVSSSAFVAEDEIDIGHGLVEAKDHVQVLERIRARRSAYRNYRKALQHDGLFERGTPYLSSVGCGGHTSEELVL